VEALVERRMDVACVQEVRWRGSGCRLFGAIGKRYKLFWMGSKAKTDGVEIFVAEKRVDSVVSVERHSEMAAVVRVEGRSTVEDWRPRNSITEFFYGLDVLSATKPSMLKH